MPGRATPKTAISTGSPPAAGDHGHSQSGDETEYIPSAAFTCSSNLPVHISRIHTNMTLDQAIQLALLATQIAPDTIRQRVIGTDAFSFGKSPDGLDILKPIPDKIRIIRDEVFTTGGPVSPASVGQKPADLMKAENARVSVQNGTQTPALASKTSDYFKGLGINVVDQSNSDLKSYSFLIVYSSKPYTVAYLAKLLDIPSSRILNRTDPNIAFDVAVILGNDWVKKTPTPLRCSEIHH